MTVKKSNVVSISLTDKNLLFLQKLGYLNRRKKSTKNFNNSEFINRCMDRIIAIEWPELDEEVEEKLLLLKMNDLQAKRDQYLKLIEKDLREVAQALAGVRDSKKLLNGEAPGYPKDIRPEVMEIQNY